MYNINENLGFNYIIIKRLTGRKNKLKGNTLAMPVLNLKNNLEKLKFFIFLFSDISFSF